MATGYGKPCRPFLLHLIFQILQESSRVVAQVVPRVENQQWRVRNAVPTASFWALVEVEFHLSTACDEQVQGAPDASGYVAASSSGVHGANWAVDGAADVDQAMETSWWSQCKPGCMAGEAWLSVIFDVGSYDIKCVRIMQVPNISHSASEVSLERWTGRDFVPQQVFRGLLSGVFENLPVEPMSKWRLRGMAAPQGWEIAEIGFFSDVECITEVSGGRGRLNAFGQIGNGSAASDLANLPNLTTDGNHSTAWAAPCGNFSSSGGHPCAELEAWIEVLLPVPGEVHCVRLLQVVDHAVEELLLQSWGASDVAEYSTTNKFSALTTSAWVWEHLVRWDVCQRAKGELWRLLPEETVEGTWTVAEYELHSDVNCSSKVQVSGAIASGSMLISTVGPNASIDGDMATVWSAPPFSVQGGKSWRSWITGNGTANQTLGHAWIGARTAPDQNVLCVRFLQSNALDSSTSTLVLQRWNGSSWEEHYEHVSGAGDLFIWYSGLTSSLTPLVPAVWLRLPAQDRSQWRITHLEVMWEHWALKEIAFFESVDCRYPVTGVPIGSDEDPGEPEHPARYAFDNDMLTEWWSACNECRPRQTWIGVASAVPRQMRCVKLFQSGIAPRDRPVPWWAAKIAIERWNGHRWAEVAEFDGLSRGSWLQLLVYSLQSTRDDAPSSLPYWTTQEDKIWRIVHVDALPLRWAVASLSFFHDVDCREIMDDAIPLSPGYLLNFGMAAAFDAEVSTEWLSACEGCSSRQAWLGLHMPVPREVRCVRLFQSVRPRVGSRAVAVERWSGVGWQQVAFLADAVPSAWEIIRTDRSAVNATGGALRWRVVNDNIVQESWRIASIRFYEAASCRVEAQGVQTESGHAMGHEPALAWDDDLDSYWESSCRGCGIARAWIGISLQPGAPPLRCVRLYQFLDTAWGSRAVAVQTWIQSSWFVVGTFVDLNYGAWDHMHFFSLPQLVPGAAPPDLAAPGTAWRIVNAAPVIRTWVVSRVGFFRFANAEDCTGLVSGVPIASGQAGDYAADGAVMVGGKNASNVSEWHDWHAPCKECATASAWIGLVLESPADVECVVMQQSQDAWDNTVEIHLQRWNGAAWETRLTFGGLSGGALLQLTAAYQNPKSMQRSRVVALYPPARGNWRVLELAFFANVECTMQVRGVAISSGSWGNYVPHLAFDQDIATFWQAADRSKEDITLQWLGSHFMTPYDVKCTRLLQGNGDSHWSTSVAVERWSGDGWERALVLDDIGSGSWFAFNIFRSAWPSVLVNFQDQASNPPEGWIVDTGKVFGAKRSGFTYGFNCDLNAVNRGYFKDVLVDTNVQLACNGAAWDLAVLSGRYYVSILFSDPGVGGETDGCLLEGTSVATGKYSEYERKNRDVTVDVYDARLTFSGSQFSDCDSIATLEARTLPGDLTMWRILNGMPLETRWRIHEFELHTSSLCTSNIFAIRSYSVLASGYYQSFEPALALDADTSTFWASPCERCAVGVAWMGAAFEALQVIKCLRLYQGLEGAGHTGEVILEAWNGTGWELQQTFSDTPGGRWGDFNQGWVSPPSGHRWRVINVDNTTAALRVAEIRFYGDAGCTSLLPGYAIASGGTMASIAAYAFDGSTETEWVSPCGPCAPRETWIGLHYAEPAELLCVSVALGSGEFREELPLLLEQWNGSAWRSTEASLLARPSAWATVSRFAMVDTLGSGQMWRLVLLVATTSPWKIQGLEFHKQAACRGQAYGTPLASSEAIGAPASLAFDDSTAFASAWIAGCKADGCAAKSEWIGILFSQPLAVQCVKIYQASKSLAGDPAAGILEVQRWEGARGWQPVRTFGTPDAVVRSGWWVPLPIISSVEKFETPAQEWRLVSELPVAQHWAIVEIAFFDNVECEGQLFGTPASSEATGNRFVANAMDSRLDTSWWSVANPPALEAWVGLAFGDSKFIQCVQLLQFGSPAGYSTPSVQLQSRPDADWLHIFSFSAVAAGQLQNLHVFQSVAGRPDGSMWRALNYDVVPDGWVLAELEFYSDAKCNRIEIGRPLASGQSSGEEVSFAFDVRLETTWRSQCRGCTRGRAWLGQSFFTLEGGEGAVPRSVDIKCVVLLQGYRSSNRSSSDTVTIERWDGSEWRRAGKFVGVPPGEFVQLLLGDDSMVVDTERMALLLSATPPPADLDALRDALSATRDRVEVDVTMYVDSWPVELTSNLAASNAFVVGFAVALRNAVAARTRQLPSYVFAGDVLLNVQKVGTRASMTASLAVFVADASDNSPDQQDPNGTRTLGLETDSAVVLNMFLDMAEDPYGLQSLFMVDRMRTELRRVTRLDPLQSSVAAQIDPSIELLFGSPVLTVAFPTTTTPTTSQPPAPAPFLIDNTWRYVLLLVGVILIACLLLWIRSCVQQRLRQIEEREMWQIARPGVPFPQQRRRSWCSWCRRGGGLQSLQEAADQQLAIAQGTLQRPNLAQAIGSRDDNYGTGPMQPSLTAVSVAEGPRGEDPRIQKERYRLAAEGQRV